MGCGGSKIDELRPVALCRDRSQHLADAIRHRYALAEAHRAYVESLRSVGPLLHRFFVVEEQLEHGSPALQLPKTRKGEAFEPLSPVSGCGSHLQLCSEDDDADSDDGCLHSEVGEIHEAKNFTFDVNSYFHYAKKGPPLSVVGFERVPVDGPEVGGVQFGSSYNGNSYGYYYGQNVYSRENDGYPIGYVNGGMNNGFTGVYGSVSNRPPPPPSPLGTSTWDFLNPFGAFESYYKSYASSRSSREVREEEGIPELEDDGHEEGVKEAYVGRDSEHCADSASSSFGNGGDSGLHGESVPLGDDGGMKDGEVVQNRARSAKGWDVLGRDKHVGGDGIEQGHSDNGPSRKLAAGSMSVPIVFEEIKAQFDKASTSCEEISNLLEVGKAPYQQWKYEVFSSKLMHATAAISLPSSSKSGERPACLEIGDVKSTDDGGMLSATLQKLYIWEKKLYEEVRAEEKMRILHDKKCKQLKRLDDTGAEAQKIDASRAMIKKLSTKIRVAIQVIGSISNRISQVRDEELWPQLNELIRGLFNMWQIVLHCHGSQFRAIVEVQALDDVVYSSVGKLTDAHMEATVQLALELLKWIECFSCWVDAMKNYVKSLNSWLLKCLNREPEAASDGKSPFSPATMGTPIFIVCNSWSRAMDRISEREVVEAMHDFATGVLNVWQQHYTERRRRLLTDKDMDRRLKALENEDQKIQKAVSAVTKRCPHLPSHTHLSFSGDMIHLGYTGEAGNLHSSLKRIFEAMERFAVNSVEAYQEL